MHSLRQIAFALSGCLLSVAAGLFCVRYSGTGREVIRDYGLSGIPYTTLWIFLTFLIFPTRRVFTLSAGCCLFVCAIEFSQLLKGPQLSSLRESFVGSMVLGNQFAWTDFPAFFVGAALAALVLKIYFNSPAVPQRTN